MSAYGLVRRAWRLLPRAVRAAVGGLALVRVGKSILRPVHDDVYDAEYYRDVIGPTADRSAPAIADSIVRDLRPRTVIDVGCGTGAIIAALRDRGTAVEGLEYSEAGLAVCRQRSLDVRRFDLERERLTPPATPYDVALSTEVAEHLPEQLADRFVDALVSQAGTVVFTAATPGQGGVDHVNEQPHSYWIAKFAARGFALDGRTADGWRREWSANPDVAPWYSANIMVFRRTAQR